MTDLSACLDTAMDPMKVGPGWGDVFDLEIARHPARRAEIENDQTWVLQVTAEVPENKLSSIKDKARYAYTLYVTPQYMGDATREVMVLFKSDLDYLDGDGGSMVKNAAAIPETERAVLAEKAAQLKRDVFAMVDSIDLRLRSPAVEDEAAKTQRLRSQILQRMMSEGNFHWSEEEDPENIKAIVVHYETLTPGTAGRWVETFDTRPQAETFIENLLSEGCNALDSDEREEGWRILGVFDLEEGEVLEPQVRLVTATERRYKLAEKLCLEHEAPTPPPGMPLERYFMAHENMVDGMRRFAASFREIEALADFLDEHKVLKPLAIVDLDTTEHIQLNWKLEVKRVSR